MNISEYFQELSKIMDQICFPRFDILRVVDVFMLGCESKTAGRVLSHSFPPDKGWDFDLQLQPATKLLGNYLPPTS